MRIFSPTCHSLHPFAVPPFCSSLLPVPSLSFPLPLSLSLSPWLMFAFSLSFNVLNERFGMEARQEHGATFPFLDRGRGQITPSHVCFAPMLRRVSYVKHSGCVCACGCVCVRLWGRERRHLCCSVCVCVCVCARNSVKLTPTSLIYAFYLHTLWRSSFKLLQCNLIIMDYYEGTVVLIFEHVIISCV